MILSVSWFASTVCIHNELKTYCSLVMHRCLCFHWFQVPFPSVHQRTATHSRFVRKNKACKHYTRDVVCLPFSSASTFRIPRGDTRANFARDDLIGKISFTSDCSEAQLREEMTAIFRRTFALSMGQSFPFEYLSTVKGCKRLMKPNVSSSFLWGGKEVASISSATCLYIMALICKPVQVHSFYMWYVYVFIYDSTEFQLLATFNVLEVKICMLLILLLYINNISLF